MSKVKGIAWEHVRNELMSNPEVQAAYEAEERKERLQAMLAEWRHHAGLTRAQWQNAWVLLHLPFLAWNLM